MTAAAVRRSIGVAQTCASLVLALFYAAALGHALTAAQSTPVNMTGTWRGTGSDYWVNKAVVDGMTVIWVLTQDGSAVSGTATTRPLKPNDGSCSACHRGKVGTVSGTVTGTALSLTMTFPGHVSEITPSCAVAFTGTAATVAPTFTTAYTLDDSCEGPFVSGLLTMKKDTFTDEVLTAGESVIRAVHVAELRTRTDAARARVGLAPFAYADATLVAGVAGIRAQHLVDLRTAVSEAYVAGGRPAPAYTDLGPNAGVVIKRVHITELRAAIEAIE